MVEIYKALADESRLRIINILIPKPLCVCEIEMILELSQSSVSRHLNRLKQAGIVDSKKESQWVFYQMSCRFIEHYKDLYDHLARVLNEHEKLREDKDKLESDEYKAMNCRIQVEQGGAIYGK